MIFSTRLKELRNEKGMTQQELEQATGIKYSNISDYETGKVTDISTSTARKLATFFDCSIDYLLGDSDIRMSLAEETATYEYSQLTHEQKKQAIDYIKFLRSNK